MKRHPATRPDGTVDFTKLTPLVDDERHGEPILDEYGSPYGTGEWSPGGYGWTGDKAPADGFQRDATTKDIADARAEARRRKAAGDQSVYAHSLACGGWTSTCGACLFEREGLNVTARRPVEPLFGERIGTVVHTYTPERGEAA